MARPKRFKVTPPETENSTANSHEVRPKRLKVTLLGAGSVSLTHSGAHSVSPPHSGARSGPSSTAISHEVRPKRLKVTLLGAGSVSLTCSGAHSVSPTCSGARSGPSSYRSGHVTMPPAYEPEHTYSSESDLSDDDDDVVVPTSTEVTTTSYKRKSYWTVNLIDEGGTITVGRLKVRDIWSLPMGNKIIMPCNELGQPIDDAGGLLGGFLGDLGSDYAKFPICYKTWRKVPVNYKNTVYDDIIQKKVLVEDERLKDYIMKSIGKKWKDTRCNLYHRFYEDSLTLEENVARRPCGIDPNQWTWFIQYRKDKKTQRVIVDFDAQRQRQFLYE